MTMAPVRSPGAGTSGSIIVDALLTSGTGTAHSSDITFGSPMYWLWEIIKAGANLYFEDDDTRVCKGESEGSK